VAGCLLGFARSLGEFGATIMVAGNIEGRTQTIPLAIYSWVQRPDGVNQSVWLVVFSILISCVALSVSQWLDKKEAYRDLR
jgi:molybdate transport system permease protein